MNHLARLGLPLFALGLAAAAQAQTAVDGVLGSEWTGVTPASVLYNPNAPTSNFGSPTNESDTTAYDIYLRADADYVYGLFSAATPQPGLLFSNLYFSTNPFGLGAGSGSVGFELMNNNAFKPGVAGNYPLPAGTLSLATANNNTIEFALPWSYFMNPSASTPAFTPITATNNKLRLNLSQTFGYSVAGGASYGDNRLGVVTYSATQAVPEPASMALLGMGGLALLRRRKKA